MLKHFRYVEGLTSLIGSTEFLTNIHGSIKDNYGEDVPSEIDSEGYEVVLVNSWDGFRTYRVADLLALTFKCYDLPPELFHEVTAFFIDGDKKSRNLKNIGYRFKSGKVEVPGHAGFYFVPGFLKFGINDKGELLNISKSYIRKWAKTYPNRKINSKGGYAYVVVPALGKERSILRHRAMLLTFEPYPDNVDSLVTNHDDGIPGNDTLDNLDWVTRGQNNTHAYETDLKSQHMRVLVRNVLTGIVTEYRSISEASFQLGYKTDETMRQRLRTSVFGQVFQDGTQCKFKSDTRDWLIPENAEDQVLLNQERRPVTARSCDTYEVRHFRSVSDFSKHINEDCSTVGLQLSKGSLKPWRKWQFKYTINETPFPEFTESDVAGTAVNPFKRLVVNARNLLSGETKLFTSVNLAIKWSNYPHLKDHLKENRQPLTASGWQFKYEDDTWKEVDNVDEVLYKLQDNAMALDVGTGKVTIASSITKLSEILGIDSKRMMRSAMTRGNEIYKGHRFRLGVTSEPWPNTQLFARELNKKRIV